MFSNHFLIGCVAVAPLLFYSGSGQTQNESTMQTKELTYLALGDSYTIGESVNENERWPVQLADSLHRKGIKVKNPLIVATTGWTTDELQAGIRKASPKGPFDLVSLLIGVNNQYRGRPVDEYRAQFVELLEQAIAFAGGDASRVFVVSIPDWGVTPFAQGRDRQKIAAEIDLFNVTARAIASKRGVLFVDITPASRQAAVDPALTAADGLHPSGVMYSQWVSQILPVVAPLVGN